MEDRLVELETRVAFQDHTIDQLNEVIIEMRAELDDLRKRLERAEGKIEEASPSAVRAEEDEDPPPHY